MAKRVRPTYTPEIAKEICERLAAGESLLDICKSPKMPPESTVRGWVIDDYEGFAARYTRARDIGLDHEADEIRAIADTCRIGQKIERKEISRCCSLCGKDARWLRGGWRHSEEGDAICEGATADKVFEEKTVEADMIERAKLQIETRKWRLSKMAPKRYGERVTLAGDPDSPLTVGLAVADVLREARRRRREQSTSTPTSENPVDSN